MTSRIHVRISDTGVVWHGGLCVEAIFRRGLAIAVKKEINIQFPDVDAAGSQRFGRVWF